MCQEHKKNCELVCLKSTCRLAICHKCALFGSHKGHEPILPEEEFRGYIKEMKIKLLTNFEEFQQEKTEIDSGMLLEKLNDKMKNNMEKDQQTVKNFYQKIRNESERFEEAAISEIKDIYKKTYLLLIF